MWNKFKVNNWGTKTSKTSFWCLCCKLWTYFTPFPSICIVIWTGKYLFGQVWLKETTLRTLSSKVWVPILFIVVVVIGKGGGEGVGVAYRRRGSNLLQIMLPERVHRLKNFQICFFGQVTNSVSFYWLRNFFNNFFLRGSNLKTLFVKFFFELILIIWECMWPNTSKKRMGKFDISNFCNAHLL